MSVEQQSTQGSTASKQPAIPSIPFADMNAGQKFVFIGKVFLFLISAGFAYPGIFSE